MLKRKTLSSLLVMTAVLLACSDGSGNGAAGGAPEPESTDSPPIAEAPGCALVQGTQGAAGAAAVRAEKVVTGLTVPWAIGFLPSGNWLVTERPGRVRLVRAGTLVASPVATVDVRATGEAGLLGLAVHPSFASNRFFYVYATMLKGGSAVNRVLRYTLSADESTATLDRVIFDDIPAASVHLGGRIRFGQDRKLYVGVGDGGVPSRAQDLNSPNGKILRLNDDGTVPADNPRAGSPVFVSGVRNPHGIDFVDANTLVVADNGPTGELGRFGHDEVSIARAGDNLGWPTIWQCQSAPGMVSPQVVWETAVPPGGAIVYRGTAIPAWTNSVLVGSLGAEMMQRMPLTGTTLGQNEIYFESAFGRLRDVEVTLSGELLATTSNCDGRGSCPADRDVILRILPQ